MDRGKDGRNSPQYDKQVIILTSAADLERRTAAATSLLKEPQK